MTNEQHTLVEQLWRAFSQADDENAWPLRSDVLRQCVKDGLQLDSLLVLGVAQNYGTEPTRIRPYLEGLIQLRQVNDVLAPLAEVAREAAKRFVMAPNFNNEPPTSSIALDEVVRLWRSEKEALLAVRIARTFSLPVSWNRSNGKHQYYFDPSHSILRYEHAEGVADLLVDRPPRADQPDKPHFELLRRAFDFAKQHGAWPSAMQFIIQHRGDFGFIPDLLSDLESHRLVRSQFYGSRDSRVELTFRALPHVTSPDCHEAVALMQAAGQAWIEKDGTTLASLASRSNLTLHTAAAILLALRGESWMRSHELDGPIHSWSIGMSERASDLLHISSWEHYLVRMHPELLVTAPSGVRRIFVSFSHADRAIADALVELLRELGLVPFMSADPQNGIEGGSPWYSTIVEQLRDSELLVLIATHNSIQQLWVHFEVGAIVGRGGQAVPLLVGLAPEELAFPLSGLQAIRVDLPSAEFAAYFARALRIDTGALERPGAIAALSKLELAIRGRGRVK